MNIEIINQLTILQKHYFNIQDKYRALAYGKALVVIRMLNFEIKDVSQLKGITGIGKKTRDKIEEILLKGKIKKVEEVKQFKPILSNKEQIIKMFEKIWGVGPVKANELYNKGITSWSDLDKNLHLLTDQQKIGYRYYDDLIKKIPRTIIDNFKSTLTHIFDTELKNYIFEIAGSYRRGKQECGDVDCLIICEDSDLNSIVNILKNWGVITDVLSTSTEKFMGIARQDDTFFRLDIEFVPKDQYASCLLYFTGSRELNIMMREQAKKQGYILNQKGLFRGGKIDTPTEESIFTELGMKYVPPIQR